MQMLHTVITHEVVLIAMQVLRNHHIIQIEDGMMLFVMNFGITALLWRSSGLMPVQG